MRLLVYGEDTYRARKKLAAMRRRFRETRDTSGLNEVVLRATDDGIERVQEALFSSPFLADRKMVVLEGYLSAPKDLQERVVEALERKPDSTVAAFFEGSSAKSLTRSPLFAALKDDEFSEEFPALTATGAERFVASECAEQGAKIELRAAKAMIAMVGTDPWALHHECAKVCAYAAAGGAGTVPLAAVEATVNGERDESVFAYTDACMQHRGGQAVSLLEQLFEQGVAELQLVSMLGKQMRTMVGAKDLMARGTNDKQAVASALGVHPFPASKAMSAVRSVALPSLLSLYGDIVETERLLKTGGTRPKVSLDLFTAKAAKTRK